jgi:hypothetical protein
MVLPTISPGIWTRTRAAVPNVIAAPAAAVGARPFLELLDDDEKLRSACAISVGPLPSSDSVQRSSGVGALNGPSVAHDSFRPTLTGAQYGFCTSTVSSFSSSFST